MIIFLLVVHDGQADTGRLAAKQAEQTLRAFLNNVDVDISDSYTERRKTGVDGFLRRLSGKFLGSHKMPTSSALAALSSCVLKYLFIPSCSKIA